MPFAINSAYLWLALAIGLAILELSTTTLVSIWFVFGSLFAFGASFITDNFMIQLAVFVLISGLSLLFTRPFVKKYLVKKPVPTNRDMLIDSVCVVTQDIYPDKKGRVMCGDVSWLAQSDKILKKGSHAKIQKISGATLTVYPLEELIGQ